MLAFDSILENRLKLEASLMMCDWMEFNQTKNNYNWMVLKMSGVIVNFEIVCVYVGIPLLESM